MKTEISYIADDGTKFTNENECKVYEAGGWVKGIYYSNKYLPVPCPDTQTLISNFNQIKTTENLTELLQDATYIFLASDKVAAKLKETTGCKDFISAGLYIFSSTSGKFVTLPEYKKWLRIQMETIRAHSIACDTIQRYFQDNLEEI